MKLSDLTPGDGTRVGGTEPMNAKIAELLAEYRRLKAEAAAIDVTPIPFPAICSEYLTRGRPVPGILAEPISKDSEFVRLGLAQPGELWDAATIDRVYPFVRDASRKYADGYTSLADRESRHRAAIEASVVKAIEITDELTALTGGKES